MVLKTGIYLSSISTVSAILIKIIKIHFPMEIPFCQFIQVCFQSMSLFQKQQQL